jgi:branched-chain amino acid aminotransferase
MMLSRRVRAPTRATRPHSAASLRQHVRCVSHGTADLEWGSLLFDYVPTKAHVEYTWKDGEWDAGVVRTTPTVETHILSNCFHYGQACFEGLKVFSTAGGDVASYQPFDGNAERMASGATRLGMPAPPSPLFNEGVQRAVRENLEYVPPYGTDGALYVRPVLFGYGAQLGLGPAPEYKFIVAVNPVGNYYAGGLKAIPGLVMTKYDRAAGRGIGGVKAAGNYVADVVPSAEAKSAGFPIALYLDAKEQKCATTTPAPPPLARVQPSLPVRA